MVKRLRIAPPFRRPAVYAALLSAAVTLFAAYFGKTVFILAAFAFLCMAFFALKRLFTAAAVALICFCLALSVGFATVHAAKVRSLEGGKVRAVFVVTEDSVKHEKSTSFSVKCVSDGVLPYGTKLSPVCAESQSVRAGDIITASVKLYDPSPYQKKILLGEGIYASSVIYGITVESQKSRFYSALGNLRRFIVKRYYTYLKGDTAALLIAVTTGNKTYLSNRLYSDIKTAGVSHMIAVSGFHLAILLGNLFILINKLGKNRFVKFGLSFLLVILIAGVCGFSKSVLRAGSMFVITAAAPLFGRESDGLSSLLASVPAVLFISPFAIYSVAFNLSVAATFSIIYISPFFLDRFKALQIPGGRWITPFAVIAVNSFFAVLFTAPIIIKTFGAVSTVGVFANLFLNYLVFAALALGAAALLLSPLIGALSGFVFAAAGFCADVMIFIINGFAQLPFASVKMGAAAYYITLAAVIAVTGFVYFKKRRERLLCRSNMKTP